MESLGNWTNNSFNSNSRVRFDLFRRFDYVAAAGDRHLAAFMDNNEHLAARENEDILDAGFSLSLSYAYEKFRNLNMLKHLTEEQKKSLFDEMVAGTKTYLKDFH